MASPAAKWTGTSVTSSRLGSPAGEVFFWGSDGQVQGCFYEVLEGQDDTLNEARRKALVSISGNE